LSYDYLFKVIVVGDAAVGKTSITTRFTADTFKDNYIMTIGVQFFQKQIKIGNKRVMFQIWDTGGQERFSFVRPFYYRGAVGALICFDLSSNDSFMNIPKWITDVYSHAGVIPMVLIGNKDDLEDERQVSEERTLSYAKLLKMPYIKTSAKTGNGVKHAFERIGRVTLASMQ
jgi:small GTP-binding protein